MNPIKRISLLLSGILLLVLLAGCGPKASGTWNSPDMGNGAGTLTLNKDGTGQLNMPPSTGPIKWTENGNAIKIFQPSDDPATATPSITGTLSDDKKTLTLDSGAALTR